MASLIPKLKNQATGVVVRSGLLIACHVAYSIIHERDHRAFRRVLEVAGVMLAGESGVGLEGEVGELAARLHGRPDRKRERGYRGVGSR